MFISDILANPTKVFPRQSEEQRKANMESLNYILNLSRQSQVNISTWDIDELFKDPNNKKLSLELIKTRNDINRIFFTEYERRKSDTSIEVNSAINVIRSKLTTASETIKRKRLQQVQANIDHEVNDNLSYALQRLNASIKAINGYRKQMDLLNGINTNDRILADLEQVLSSGFYTFVDMTETKLILSTTNQIVMTQKNPSANIDISVNLGKYYINFYFEDSRLEVLPKENNVAYDSKYHPYISARGQVCFGDGEPMAVDYRAKMDMKGLFTLLQAILTTYSDSTPYVRLSDLDYASKNGGSFNSHSF